MFLEAIVASLEFTGSHVRQGNLSKFYPAPCDFPSFIRKCDCCVRKLGEFAKIKIYILSDGVIIRNDSARR